MKIIVLCMAVLVCVAVAFGWKYSCNTTWTGSTHLNGSTNFTPGTTTAYVTLCSPVVTPCPDESDEPPYCIDYYARARLQHGEESILAQKRCGGIAYNSGTVTTTDQWTLTASIELVDPECDSQFEGQGPVGATASDSQQNCTGN